jgi:uncharacterized protein (DUF885 family)
MPVARPFARAALVAALALSLSPAAAAPSPHQEFLAARAAYLDGLFAAKPHLATFMGDHRFDARLPDLSPAARAAREKVLARQRSWLDRYRQRAGSGHRAAYPLDDVIDAEVMADGIALELLYLREIRDFAWDPRLNDSFPYYDPREIVAGRLSDILHGEFAPEPARRASVVGQLRALPHYLGQVRAALLSGKPRLASPEYAEQGIKVNAGRIEFFNTEVKEFLKAAPAAEQKALATAVAALQDFQRFLEKDLRPRATGDWRLGAALYEKKFPLALQTRLTPAEAAARARADFTRSRAELLTVALALHDQLFPAEPRLVGTTPGAADAARIIARIKNQLAGQHPRADELVEAHARNLDRLRAFIEAHDLLTLPPRETLRVAPMPPFKRGAAAAEYLAPGILEGTRDFRATYYVDPIDPTWTPERVESYLRGQNDYGVELTAAHEAYPGHHTQFSYERHDLDPLRATLWNGAMVEGWAVYATTLLTHLGYGGERARGYLFEDLRGHMVVATNTLIDVGLQTGTMTDAEAVRFMVEEGFQEQAVAEKKLLRAKLDSTQLAQYFLGYSEITQLEADQRARLGARFSQRAFDEALIGHGSIAVRHLRAYLEAAAPR